MKKILSFMFAAILVSCANSASRASIVTVLDESFDDSSQFTTSTGFFSDGTGDYFGLTGPTEDFGAGGTPSGLKDYTGFSGSILTGQDFDGDDTSITDITVTWSDLDIAGQTGLLFSGDFAEFFDSPGDIDAADELFVEAQIDGGGFFTILEFTPGSFTSTSGPTNGFFELGEATLGTAAQTFEASIAGSGALLDLRLTVELDSGDEDFGVDNFLITSTAVPEPTSFAMFGVVGLAGALRRRR